MGEINNRKLKRCLKCKKTFVESIGFNQYSNKYYRSYCKSCDKKIDELRRIKNKGFLFTYHSWDDDKCRYCGLNRNRVLAVNVNVNVSIAVYDYYFDNDIVIPIPMCDRTKYYLKNKNK